MANESVLKKEFNSRDVERIRNLVKKDYGSGTRQGIGYEKQATVYKEGDIWEENGKQWTIKNGIKQSISKLNIAKKALQMPLACPTCGNSMKKRLDKKMYAIHGVCFDCTIKHESALKKAGLYATYEKRITEGNMKAFITDIEQWAENHINTVDTFVTEQGEVENWSSGREDRNKQVMTNIRKYVDQLREHLK